MVKFQPPSNDDFFSFSYLSFYFPERQETTVEKSTMKGLEQVANQFA